MTTKERIQVYADPETKRRIELAAAKRDVPVTEYCLDAIVQQLVEDDVLEQERIEIAVRPGTDDDLFANLRALHARILAERGGRLFDVDADLDAIRAEREDEILGLR